MSAPTAEGMAVDGDKKPVELKMKIQGKWVQISESQILKHPGGNVITQYSGSDATQIFDAFHAGSAKAYKQLKAVLDHNTLPELESATLEATMQRRFDQTDVNISSYDISIEEEKKICQNFEELRMEVIRRGMMEGAPLYYVWKAIEIIFMFGLTFYFQYREWYFVSALILGLNFQQLGWLAHEFSHQQPTKNRANNDWWANIFGNVFQGYSIDWWKDKHNTHHATTNIVDQDGDIDIVPLFSLIPADLLKYKAPVERLILKFVPYQHLYFTFSLPLIRLSWLSQSLGWAFTENSSAFRVYRRNALAEQSGLVVHWMWVALQLYLLPDNFTRVWYFLLSQSLCGLLTGHVVTYSHNSVDKYPANSRLLNNFAALQILTTRNMLPSPFIDWFWGGLNYQIEHHLFPTMPRCHLNECSKLVKKFCADNNLPYLVDDYTTGYKYNLDQLERIAQIAADQKEQ